MRSALAILCSVPLLASMESASAQGQSGAVAAPYTVLDDEFSQLRADFNRAKGSVRLLFVVDPICPGCLRGMDDMNRDLLSKTRDVRLQTFVVHVPVLGAKAKDIAPSAKLLQNAQVRHYWNASGEFGRTLAKAVELRNDKDLVYAWDVWLLYGPDVEWTESSPPKPQLLMHQLWKLEGTKFAKLDSEVFAQEAHKWLDAPVASGVTKQ